MCEITTKFSLDENAELELGLISESETNDLVEGLNVLKTVKLDKSRLEENIKNFNTEPDYIIILQSVLEKEQDAPFFQQTTEKLIKILQKLMQDKNFEQTFSVLKFITGLLNQDHPERKKSLTASTKTCPLAIINAFTKSVLQIQDAQKAESLLHQLAACFKEGFISILVNIYTAEEKIPFAQTVQKIISDNYAAGAFVLNQDLHRQSPANIMRLIDLFQTIDHDEIVMPLKEIARHENVIIATRALKRIAQIKSAKALAVLLEFLEHSRPALRIASVEYLGDFPYKQVRTALEPIAQGMGKGKNVSDISIRIAALESLLKIDPVFAKSAARKILNKKLFLLFPVEPKQLRETAKKCLKNIA